jgi:tRNA-splicing ligase RtcB
MDDEYREAGVVVNADGRVPLDEAAPCYKPSEEVVAAVVGAGLAEIEHSLWPLASLKGVDELKRRKGKGRQDRRGGRAQGKKTSEHY